MKEPYRTQLGNELDPESEILVPSWAIVGMFITKVSTREYSRLVAILRIVQAPPPLFECEELHCCSSSWEHTLSSRRLRPRQGIPDALARAQGHLDLYLISNANDTSDLRPHAHKHRAPRPHAQPAQRDLLPSHAAHAAHVELDTVPQASRCSSSPAPAGSARAPVHRFQPTIDSVRETHPLTSDVCKGASLPAQAGVLDGKRATERPCVFEVRLLFTAVRTRCVHRTHRTASVS